MTQIGALAVGLRLETEKFSKGAKTARTQLDRLKESTASFRRSMLRLSATLAGAFAAGSIVRSLRQTANEMDRMTDVASKLGLSTEALSSLHFAAEMSGVGIKTLEMAMQRMTRRVAEAAQGLGEARGALGELGIDAQKLAQMTPDQQLMQLADRLQLVESQSDRLRLAFKLFDSEGVDLVRMLGDGSDRLREMMDEARRLGVTFNELEAQQIAKANDAITRMGNAWLGVSRILAVELAPALEATTASFASWATSAESATDEAGRLSRWAIKAADVLHTIPILFKRLQVAGVLTLDTITKSMERLNLIIIEALNKIPGINLDDEITDRQLRFSRSQEERSMQIAKLAGELDRLLVAETPSERRRRLDAERDRSAARGEMQSALLTDGLASIARDISGLSLAAIHRIESQVSGFLLDRQRVAEEMVPRRGVFAHHVPTHAALERGTAAAFSQERRSAQQNQMLDVARKSLRTEEKQLDALHQIDRNMANISTLEAAAFTG